MPESGRENDEAVWVIKPRVGDNPPSWTTPVAPDRIHKENHAYYESRIGTASGLAEAKAVGRKHSADNVGNDKNLYTFYRHGDEVFNHMGQDARYRLEIPRSDPGCEFEINMDEKAIGKAAELVGLLTAQSNSGLSLSEELGSRRLQLPDVSLAVAFCFMSERTCPNSVDFAVSGAVTKHMRTLLKDAVLLGVDLVMMEKAFEKREDGEWRINEVLDLLDTAELIDVEYASGYAMAHLDNTTFKKHLDMSIVSEIGKRPQWDIALQLDEPKDLALLDEQGRKTATRDVERKALLYAKHFDASMLLTVRDGDELRRVLASPDSQEAHLLPEPLADRHRAALVNVPEGVLDGSWSAKDVHDARLPYPGCGSRESAHYTEAGRVGNRDYFRYMCKTRMVKFDRENSYPTVHPAIVEVADDLLNPKDSDLGRRLKSLAKGKARKRRSGHLYR